VYAMDMRRPNIAMAIAARLGELHRTVAKHYPSPLPPSSPDDDSAVALTAESWWQCVLRWFPLARETLLTTSNPVAAAYTQPSPRDPSRLVIDDLFDLATAYHRHTRTLASPIVFGHNDLQYGNILLVKSGSDTPNSQQSQLASSANVRVAMIDYEYGGYNPQAYDLANHVCEYLADYHHPTHPELAHHTYPTPESRAMFLRAYLESWHGAARPAISDADIAQLDRQVQAYRAASHWVWALWGCTQIGRDDIDFNYVGYSTWRLEAFRELATEVLKEQE